MKFNNKNLATFIDKSLEAEKERKVGKSLDD